MVLKAVAVLRIANRNVQRNIRKKTKQKHAPQLLGKGVDFDVKDGGYCRKREQWHARIV
jgi:hypothetical protein